MKNIKIDNKNILLIYPEYPETFWSFKHALKFISKKAAYPPLGLITVSSMLPDNWNQKLLDMNTTKLNDKDIKWADYIFISAMSVQRKNTNKILDRVKKFNKKVVAGGPLFTSSYEEFKDKIDHFVLNEAEITLPMFLKDLKNNCLKKIYKSEDFPDLNTTPKPNWELVKLRKYASMVIQYSRGCPFDCEFCDITTLFGRKVRTKSAKQIIAELETLYSNGWRGNVFFVDDNFIGNTKKLKREILPAIINWMKKRNYPFTFTTESSINLSDDEKLIRLMINAGFITVFIGIETPEEDSLAECCKFQNKNRDLLKCVRKIQDLGLKVTGGFIVGFDNDKPSIFQKQIDFIQKSGIVMAMVSLLNAPKNSRLYKRLSRENRLLKEISGDNTDFSINFIPKMDETILIKGYKKIINRIYSCKPYHERIMEYFRNKQKSLYPVKLKYSRLRLFHIIGFIKSIYILGIKDKGRLYYWKLLLWSIFQCPRLIPSALIFSAYGFHFRKIFQL